MVPDDDMASVGIGLPTSGMPMPRVEGFIGRLRRTLERLEVGMFCELFNVDAKQERYIRARLPRVQRAMDCKFSVRVGSNKRNPSAKRTLHIWRLE